MPRLENIRSSIETLLSALAGEADIAEGVSLRLPPASTITLQHRNEPRSHATLRFEPPPEITVQRGPFRLRCTLTAMTIGTDEVRLAIDGWYDRRWKVES